MIGLHMLHPLNMDGGGGGSPPPPPPTHTLRHHTEHIVRIPAKTALPIVSSVPKCRNSSSASKGSRSQHNNRQVDHTILVEQTGGGGRGGGRSVMPPVDYQMATTSISHSRSAQNQGRSSSKCTSQLGGPSEDRVLLLVNDDHIKGGGVPVIGRRLPSKSVMMAHSGYLQAEIEHHHTDTTSSSSRLAAVVDYSQPPTIHVADQHVPVVGRRSHRMVQQQQQQQQQQPIATTMLYQRYDYHPDDNERHQPEYRLESGSGNGSGGRSRVNRSSSHDHKQQQPQTSYKQQPLSIVETHLAHSQTRQVHHLLAATNHSKSLRDQSGGNSGGSRQRHSIKQYESSGSMMNIAHENNPVPATCFVANAPNSPISQHQYRLQQGKQSRSVGSMLQALQPITQTTHPDPSSGSCASLCSTATLHDSIYQAEGDSCDGYSCCPSCPSSPTGGRRLLEPYHRPVVGSCQEPCCRYGGEQAYGGGQSGGSRCAGQLARSVSCQRVPTCCAPPPTTHIVSQVAPKSTTCNKDHYHHRHQNHNHAGSHHQQHRQARTANHSYHHSHCQANDGSLVSKPSVAYRSSSCHNRSGGEQPMLMSGRNVLPVQPKPTNYHLVSALPQQGGDLQRGLEDLQVVRMKMRSNSNSKPGVRRSSHQSTSGGKQPAIQTKQDTEAVAAVTQMYESLAAELKAKLGDPKMGPILLPPKDYDTMSRKQGKLNGIELRRSTNPQLVGPTANRLATNNCIINEEQQQQANSNSPDKTTSQQSKQLKPVCPDGPVSVSINHNSPSAGCGSARSSGRSQDDRSLQRSRSNSSSGLGSISMGAGSPSNSPPSSKSSSNEDMRHHPTTRTNCSTIGNDTNSFVKINQSLDGETTSALVHGSGSTSPLDRKNCSPDTNCGSSDSGHSGSGRMDSGPLSNEDQKIMSMLHDSTSDFFKPNNTNNSNNPAAHREDTDSCAKARRLSGVGSLPNSMMAKQVESQRGKGIHNHNPSKVSDGVLWNGRVEIPLKVNNDKNGNTYLATKQIIY